MEFNVSLRHAWQAWRLPMGIAPILSLLARTRAVCAASAACLLGEWLRTDDTASRGQSIFVTRWINFITRGLIPRTMGDRLRRGDEPLYGDAPTRRVAHQFIIQVGALSDDVVVGALQQVQQVLMRALQLLDLLLDQPRLPLHRALPVPIPAP
ncbi:hypothetical protein ACFQ61_15780 [Streptomyces sp. NPDC056500]|uniref:hypothetical protein n=1 Tax=Streptomyces sp. NPDC056500 TaxID=3345840 RepID=UPI0036B754C4